MTKNWTLVAVRDTGTYCQACGAKIRWAFHLEQGSLRKIVGSECVKSHLDRCDPQTALAFVKGKWRARRNYFYKRVAGETYVVGPMRGGGWYAARAPYGVTGAKWEFLRSNLPTYDAAVQFLAGVGR